MRADLYQEMFDIEEKHWWHIAKRETCKTLLERYFNPKDGPLLDIGCGTGKNIETFGGYGKIYGVDPSPEAVSFCRRRGIVNVKLTAGEKTGYPKGQFALVTMLDVLEHADDKKLLAETNRILAPKGWLLVTVPAYPFLWSGWDVILKHKKRYTAPDLIKTLENGGFKVVKISYMFSFLLLPVMVVRFFKSVFSGSRYTSDFKIQSPLINWIGLKAAAMERFMIVHGGIPFGTSIICIAKKP